MAHSLAQPESDKKSLFRDGVGRTSNDELGRLVSWYFPRPRLWAWSYCIAIVVAVAGLSQMEYAEKVAVAGSVRLLHEPASVFSAESGIVRRVLVTSGEAVTPGQPLVVIDKSLHGGSGASNYDRSARAAQMELDSLARERVRHEALFSADVTSLDKRATHLRKRRASLSTALQIAHRRAGLLADDDARVQTLSSKGWLSSREANGSALTLLEAQGAVVAHAERVAGIDAELGDLGQQRLRLGQQRALQDEQFNARQAKATAAREEARDGATSLISSPMAGNVMDLQAALGQRVSAAQFLLSVASSAHSIHEVDLWLPSQAVGRVHQGMPVRLRYEGFPFQEYGSGHGVLKQVSDVPRVEDGRASFRARVAVQRMPKGVAKVPVGMHVSADILLQSKSLGAWLGGPLATQWRRL